MPDGSAARIRSTRPDHDGSDCAGPVWTSGSAREFICYQPQLPGASLWWIIGTYSITVPMSGNWEISPAKDGPKEIVAAFTKNTKNS